MTGQHRNDELTAKQWEFARGLAEGLSNSEAYRRAYPAWRGGEKALSVESSRLAAVPKITHAIGELRKPVTEKCRITLESLTRDVLEDRGAARAAGHTHAAVAANALLAKLHGLLVVDRSNNRNPLEDWTAEQIDEALKRLEGQGEP